MRLNDFARERNLPLAAVREAARDNAFPSDHYNSKITPGQIALLDRWFAVNDSPAARPAPASLPEYFQVDLPLCLLGPRTVRVTEGETLDARRAAAFETYKRSGGIRGSRFVPTITPLDAPAAVDAAGVLSQTPP